MNSGIFIARRRSRANYAAVMHVWVLHYNHGRSHLSLGRAFRIRRAGCRFLDPEADTNLHVAIELKGIPSSVVYTTNTNWKRLQRESV